VADKLGVQGGAATTTSVGWGGSGGSGSGRCDSGASSAREALVVVFIDDLAISYEYS
jgi:hypothetical protein